MNLWLQQAGFFCPFQNQGTYFFLIFHLFPEPVSQMTQLGFQLSNLALIPKKAFFTAGPIASRQDSLRINNIPVRRDKGPPEAILLP